MKPELTGLTSRRQGVESLKSSLTEVTKTNNYCAIILNVKCESCRTDKSGQVLIIVQHRWGSQRIWLLMFRQLTLPSARCSPQSCHDLFLIYFLLLQLTFSVHLSSCYGLVCGVLSMNVFSLMNLFICFGEPHTGKAEEKPLFYVNSLEIPRKKKRGKRKKQRGDSMKRWG